MDIKDLGLQICSADPVYVDGVPIYPLTLNTIAKYGYQRFNEEMRVLCLTQDEIYLHISKEASTAGAYAFLVANALKSKNMMETLEFWLSQITRSRVLFSKKRVSFSDGVFEITKENFDEIQSVIRIRNGMQDADEDDENPANEAARRVLLRRKEERLKRRKAKKNDEESELALEDLVSILASGMNMTMDDVMKNYDLYQFNNQFNRLKIMDDYNVSVQALLHGAKKESVNLKHWISKIEHNKD